MISIIGSETKLETHRHEVIRGVDGAKSDSLIIEIADRMTLVASERTAQTHNFLFITFEALVVGHAASWRVELLKTF